MAEWKVVKMDKLGLKQDLDEMWEIVYQGEDFILIHHFDSYQIYNRTIDEFIFIFKEENKKVIEKCKKYINMYNKTIKIMKQVEENYLFDEYPRDDIASFMNELEEEWEKIKEKD